MAASAAFTANGSTPPLDVAANAAVTLSLVSVDGVNTIEWFIRGKARSSHTTPTFTLSGSPVGATAQITVGAQLGQGYLIECRVNGGRDAGGNVVAAQTVRGTVFVLNATGRRPLIYGEELETDSTVGQYDRLNSALDAGGGGSLNAPNNPADDGKLAVAQSGNLSYATSVSGLTALSFGSTPSSAGQLRLSHGQSVQGRNQANSADRSILSWGLLANDVLKLGDSGTGTRIDAASFIELDIGGAEVARVGNGFLSIGANSANAGQVRLAHATSIRGRNNANSADIYICAHGLDGPDITGLGDTNNASTLIASGANGVALYPGGTNIATFYSDRLELGTGTKASAGTLRLPNNSSILARNSTNTADFGITFNSSNQTSIGGPGGITLAAGVTVTGSSLAVSAGGLTCSLTTSAVSFTGTTTDRTIGHASGSVATAPKLSIFAMDVTGAGQNAGHMLIRAGRKTSTGTDGNIALHADPAAWQSMERGMFLGNCTTIPSGNPTSGGFLYVEAGALKYRGSSGTITTVGAA